MLRTRYMSACAFSVLALGLGTPAFAQSAASGQDDVAQAVPDIVVTGSLIKGTPEDAALPVDVISGEELARQGQPSTVELLKAHAPGTHVRFELAHLLLAEVESELLELALVLR